MGLIPILGISSIISLDIMADATEKGASKEAPFFIAARKRGFFRAQRARGVYAARKGCSFFAPIGRRGFNRSAAALHPFSRASAGGGAACAPRHQRGYSLFEENTPFESPEKDEGRPPSTPDIAGLWLEELLSLRNRVRCTWLRHEFSASRYVLQSRLTVVRRV